MESRRRPDPLREARGSPERQDDRGRLLQGDRRAAGRGASAVEHAPAEPHQELHVCMECFSELVYPVHWDEAGPENWNVLLHCPNCDVYREGIFAQDTVEAFDEELDRGGDALARDYKRLMRANMAEEIERFAAPSTPTPSSPKTSRPGQQPSPDRRSASPAGLIRRSAPPRRRPRAAAPARGPPAVRAVEPPFAAATCRSACSRASSSAPVAAMRSQSASACAASWRPRAGPAGAARGRGDGPGSAAA